MIIGTKTELLSVLRKYNPWWMNAPIVGLPSWKRTVFPKVFAWVKNPPGHRALLLSGARQIGKTTLLLQTIEALLESGVLPSKILYVTFDHPLMKLYGVEKVIDLWQELEPEKEGIEYLFLDEIQYVPGWQTWLKHQVDFCKNRRIAVTGSATPLVTEGQESGVGRWHTLSLGTLSFFEYLLLKGKSLLEDPKALGIAVETAFFKHAILAYGDKSSGFSYWRGTRDHEVDLVATVAGEFIPFEVKYRDQATGAGELKGLKEFCTQKKVSRGYVITKECVDFSLMSLSQDVTIAKIPAPLACYWFGEWG